MPDIEASVTRLIAAPPAQVYEILADYQRGHPSILPPRYFSEFRVEEGGRGAGTRIAFTVRSFGTTRRLCAIVAEPEPGRRLVETDVDSGAATSFLVEPARDGASRVTIATRYRKPGPAGWVERWLAPGFLRRLYQAELALLAERAGSR